MSGPLTFLGAIWQFPHARMPNASIKEQGIWGLSHGTGERRQLGTIFNLPVSMCIWPLAGQMVVGRSDQ